ncbi:class I SAM-dependent methyltransferase [Candidatus Woesearchaeota archaeon]|nr:class I SAM-dependent methyltransferase [Candidatus Woesearchaeota archaeon]
MHRGQQTSISRNIRKDKMDSFDLIKETYQELHSSFLQKHPTLVKYLGENVWAPSLPKELYKIFKKYGSTEKKFLDLGSGDGIVVMVAALFFNESHGVEVEKEFFDISLQMEKKLGLSNVRFIEEDFLKLSFSSYDVLFIAPDKEFSLRLEKKILDELDGILIVYSSIFQPKTLKKIDEFETHYFTVCVYENKAKKVLSS